MGWTFEIGDGSRIIELGFPYSSAMPRVPEVPPFVVATGLAHDTWRLADDSSGCHETVLIGTHAGTHIDGLAHVSHGGLLHGGVPVADAQTRWGVPYLDMTTVAPIVGRGVLIDLPALLGVDLVDTPVELDASRLDREVRTDLDGSIVLLRTGWGTLWRADPPRYAATNEARPGFTDSGAAWLAAHGVVAVGSDSFSVEVLHPRNERPAAMPAHVELLVQSGVHIFEAMDLDELATAGPTEFLVVALPLRMEGATGSPVRPIAIV